MISAEASSFALIDLCSQSRAVNRVLEGASEEEKLAWFAKRGRLEVVDYSQIGSTARSYWFTSPAGISHPFHFYDGNIAIPCY